MEFFANMDPLLQAFWYIALPTSLIFIVQTIMTFIGADASDGVDADFSGDFNGGDAPFQLFSLRNMINFLLGFSWGGISLFKSIPSSTLLILVAVVIGALFVAMFLGIIRQIQRLAEDNTFRIEACLGKTASVYLKVPEDKSGKGIVQVSVNGSTHEIPAATAGPELASGTLVKVIEVLDANLLLVEKV